jgi:crotonobetainyl-CoA:carnitine CoA-transferase CaiB-like acyl-CoA transferase
VTELDWYKGIGTPIKFSRTGGGTRRPPPRFNEHGTEVLIQHGYTEAEIEELRAAGVLYAQRKI